MIDIWKISVLGVIGLVGVVIFDLIECVQLGVYDIIVLIVYINVDELI